MAEHPAHRLGGRSPGQRQAELLVLVRGGDELVGVRLDADGDPDQHLLPDALAGGDRGEALDLLVRVDHDVPDAGLHGVLQLVHRLVVAVQRDPLRRHPGGQRHRQLARAAHVEVEALLVQPAHDGLGEERLAGVVDVRLGAEGVPPGARPGPEVLLVQQVRRGAELGRQPLDVDPADGGHALGVAGDGAGPDLGVERVQVRRRGLVVAVGEHVAVPGACGVCGTTHACSSFETYGEGRPTVPVDRRAAPAVRLGVVPTSARAPSRPGASGRWP